MVSQSGRIEGVAFSAPQPEALAPLFDALGAVAQPRQCLEKEAAVQRFGLSAGRAEIAPFLLGHERIEIIHFPDAPLRHKVDPGPSNTLWFQHVAIVVRDLVRASERLAPVVTPISAAPQYLPNGVGAWKFRNACGHASSHNAYIQFLSMHGVIGFIGLGLILYKSSAIIAYASSFFQ